MAGEEVNHFLLLTAQLQERVRQALLIGSLNHLLFVVSFQDYRPVDFYIVEPGDFRLRVRIHELVFDVLAVVLVRIQKFLCLVPILCPGARVGKEELGTCTGLSIVFSRFRVCGERLKDPVCVTSTLNGFRSAIRTITIRMARKITAEIIVFAP